MTCHPCLIQRTFLTCFSWVSYQWWSMAVNSTIGECRGEVAVAALSSFHFPDSVPLTTYAIVYLFSPLFHPLTYWSPTLPSSGTRNRPTFPSLWQLKMIFLFEIFNDSPFRSLMFYSLQRFFVVFNLSSSMFHFSIALFSANYIVIDYHLNPDFNTNNVNPFIICFPLLLVMIFQIVFC